MCDTKRSIGRKCESGLAVNVPLLGVFVQDYDSHTPPKLTDKRIQMDAQTRRRERRAEKQAQWKAANPLLVGVSAKPVNRPILSLNRKPKSRVESALNPIDLTVLAEYHEQIESNLQRIERKNHRVWYSKPSEFGITCQGRQKVKGKSIPLA